jgi:hypothetical protein
MGMPDSLMLHEGLSQENPGDERSRPGQEKNLRSETSEEIGKGGDLNATNHLVYSRSPKTVAFLGTLTGKQPKLGYPVLPASTDATPHPILK